MAEKNRPLYILKYLLDNTDEDHPAIINDILAYLEERGIHATRKTVATDLAELQDSGFDVICNKSRQNKYFIGARSLELAELKMIVDAIQAAKFISPTKSLSLIDKLSSLASPYQAAELKRKLYVEGKAKTTNESVYYTSSTLTAPSYGCCHKAGRTSLFPAIMASRVRIHLSKTQIHLFRTCLTKTVAERLLFFAFISSVVQNGVTFSSLHLWVEGQSPY